MRQPIHHRSPRRRVERPFATAVLIGVTSAVLLFSALTLVTTWLRERRLPEPHAFDAFAALPAAIDVWVGDVAPGVKGVLATDWNQPAWDARQDDVLSEALGRRDGDALAFASLVVFNTSTATARVPTGEGSLVLRDSAGAVAPAVSLSRLLAGVEGGSAATTLRFLGAGRDEVEVPPGRMVRVPVAFPRRVPLSEAAAVERADGSAFRRRRMTQREWAGLLQSPSVDALRDL
jgi:hypothetical protein